MDKNANVQNYNKPDFSSISYSDFRPSTLEKVQELVRLRIYQAYAFGLPLLIIAIAIILDNLPNGEFLRPRFGQTRCGFDGKLRPISGDDILVYELQDLLLTKCSRWRIKQIRAWDIIFVVDVEANETTLFSANKSCTPNLELGFIDFLDLKFCKYFIVSPLPFEARSFEFICNIMFVLCSICLINVEKIVVEINSQPQNIVNM